MMKRTWLVCVGAVVALGLLVPAAGVAGPDGGSTPIKVGPVAIVDADDIGTCNNVWALDSFNKFYKLTPNRDGTYNLQVNYKDGTFVTLAGKSPGACESGADNGSTVTAGITGRTHQEYDATVSATSPPNSSPECGPDNAGCLTASSFLDAVFGVGTWTNTSGFGWTGHYQAGSNGTWFDTSVDWPLNDRGDITS